MRHSRTSPINLRMFRLFNRLPPSVIALLLQLAAWVLVWGMLTVTGLHTSVLQLALLCGVLAAVLSYYAGLARWWWFIQLFFAPALVLMLGLQLPPYLFLFLFLLLLLVYWSTFRTQVPLYLSSHKVWQELEHWLPAAKTDVRFTFMDLGCGLGGVLTHLARVRPDGFYTGVEAAPLPFLWSWLRTKLGGYRNCRIDWGSLWDCDLYDYDVVFAYLSPVPMEQLWHKARAEMRPGTLFISSTFSVPDQSPQESIQVDDLHHSTLLVWRM